MAKLIRISDTKAYQVSAIKLGGKKMLSVRQMYATKKDPDLKPGRQGMTIPYDDDGRKVVRALVRMFKDEELKFEVIKDKED